MKTVLFVILTAAITNNYVLVKFLGICPFLGVSKKLDQATGMSIAVIFVEVLATAVTWPIYHLLLAGKVDFTYMETVVFILVIAICAIVGLANGLVVSYLKVQPFIATLGMQQVVYGICLVYTGGTPIGSLNKNFTSLASNTIIGIPVLIWIALIVAFCFWFLYNKTRHGKYMYAIGGNEAAAEVAGVNVYATKIRIYILASCMFGLAGCLLAAKSGGASVNTAQGYELDAIAASTIGGVSTTGGVGTVPGILVGVLVFELMKVALQFMNVNSSYTYIVQGLVIIVAVAIDIRKYLAKK